MREELTTKQILERAICTLQITVTLNNAARLALDLSVLLDLSGEVKEHLIAAISELDWE